MLNQKPQLHNSTASEKLGAPFGTDLFRGSPTGPLRWNSTKQDFASTVWVTLCYLLTEKCEWHQQNLYGKTYGKLIFKFIELVHERFMNLLHFAKTSSYKFFEDWPSLHFVQPMGWHKNGDMAA